MPEYPSLAALRSGLTTDDADERGRAYGAVLGAEGDVQPSDVLSADPSDDVVRDLVDANVVPRSALSGSGADGRQSSSELRQRQVELLEAILEELSSDATVQEEI